MLSGGVVVAQDHHFAHARGEQLSSVLGAPRAGPAVVARRCQAERNQRVGVALPFYDVDALGLNELIEAVWNDPDAVEVPDVAAVRIRPPHPKILRLVPAHLVLKLTLSIHVVV